MRGKIALLWGWIFGISMGLYLSRLSFSCLNKKSENVAVKGVFETDKIDASAEQPLQIAIVTCFGQRNGSIYSASIWNSQLRQLRVLFKSLALMTSSKVQINIVTPYTSAHKEIMEIPNTWPEEYRKRLIFGKPRKIYYPEKLAYIQHMTYRRCATAKLFLPDVFYDMDNLIYVDTDVLFMAPLEDLWEEFKNFEAMHICGIAPGLSRYGRNFTDFVAYGFSGLNTGVILMNLTRMRNFKKGWTRTISEWFLANRESYRLSDQDILTNYFSEEREKYLYELGCEWNYRATVCQGMNKCQGAASRGVAILHGCDNSFRSDRDFTIKAVFEAWERYEIGSPIEELMSLLEEAVSLPYGKGCIKLSNIKDIFLKGIKRHFANRGHHFQ